MACKKGETYPYILYLICHVRLVLCTAFWKSVALWFPVDVETNSTPSHLHISVFSFRNPQ